MSNFIYYKTLLHSCFTICLFCCMCVCVNSAKAQPVLTFAPVIRNLTLPIAVRNAGDSSGRLFICEQGGLIKIYKNNRLLAKPFLDLTSIVKNDGEYPGLYSIAFSPDYKTSRFFFVYYVSNNNQTTIARYQSSKTNPDSAVASSGVVLLSVDGRGTGGAHTGDMHFGRDGNLYITFNDGSFYSRTTTFAQDGQSLLGKMLRLDVKLKSLPYYTIPADNPFVTNPNIRDELWALGLRNGWRWSFDRLTGNMWIADVGGDKWEEVDVRTPGQPAGVNFGWPCYEGNAIFDTAGCAGKGNYVFPIFQYAHVNATSAEVITGGYVYRGTAYPALQGYYICMDYTTGNAWKLFRSGTGKIMPYMQAGLPPGIVDFGEDESGELYAASLSAGVVYRVQASVSETIIAMSPSPGD